MGPTVPAVVGCELGCVFGDLELLLDKLDPMLPFGGPSKFSDVSILRNRGALGRDVPGVLGDRIGAVP